MTEQQQSERQKRVAARKAQLAALHPKTAGVRVEPASDDLRRVLKHPKGIKFPSTGSVEWPNDRFTKRRIADGSVKVVEHAAPAARSHSRPHRTAE